MVSILKVMVLVDVAPSKKRIPLPRYAALELTEDPRKESIEIPRVSTIV